MGHREQALDLIACDPIGQTLGLRGLDKIGLFPGLVEFLDIEELQAIQIELDGAPGLGLEPLDETIDPLCLSEVIDLTAETGNDPADGAGIDFEGLGAQALELEMSVIRALELGLDCWCHGEVTSRFLQEWPLDMRGWGYILNSEYGVVFLRVAASSNKSINGDRKKRVALFQTLCRR